MSNLFLDIYPLSERATNDALEYIFKAHDHGGDGIWSPHESPLIRRLVELFTKRGLDRLDAVQKQILAWEAGDHHKPSEAPVARPGMMERWNEAELSLVKLYLESLPPEQWGLDDHMMAVDYVVQRYLPADELKTEAEWLSTRAGMMGKVQANLDAAAVATMTGKGADAILAALPSTVAQAVSQFNLPAQQRATLEFARVRTAENVRALTDSVRHRMRNTIVQHLEEQQTTAAGVPGQALQSKLFDQFAMLNRDWRRIAVTEAGEAQTQGYIASLKPGTKVKRVEQYATACGFCKKIDGVIATVVAADAPDKDPETQIWPGKNNVGRSASPRKRVGDQLVARDPDEMWQLPAGLAHPHCRGRWVPVIEDEPGDDPEFADMLRELLA
ncbi:hypothetical protein FHR70_000738 [Microvirga lupini]|uniref:Phage Mu protein F like protein n=1 Tax=Microvirga lupini TaxID=420324 RepID=A0A7W4VI92_9HYPH|nr:hypothetical protein [Microvirga lupini]MBB3017698.1 hypothetical protein [Microvirga lupini]